MFDPQVDPGQILRQLQTLRQNQRETIQDFSQRVRFTMRTYPNQNEPLTEALAVIPSWKV